MVRLYLEQQFFLLCVFTLCFSSSLPWTAECFCSKTKAGVVCLWQFEVEHLAKEIWVLTWSRTWQGQVWCVGASQGLREEDGLCCNTVLMREKVARWNAMISIDERASEKQLLSSPFCGGLIRKPSLPSLSRGLVFCQKSVLWPKGQKLYVPTKSSESWGDWETGWAPAWCGYSSSL